MDVPPDTWLTLTEAAARTGHTREAIRQRIRRRKLPATKGNDGQHRVRMRDLADLPPPDVSTDDHGQPGDTTPDATVAVPLATLVDLRTTVDDLRTTVAATVDKAHADHLVDHGRAERAEARADQEAERANRAEAREREARALADQRGVEMTAALVRAARAEGELAEARRPAWRRWLGLS